jgi:hypothetical protein
VKRVLAVLFAALLSVGFQSNVVLAKTTEEVTREIVDHHWKTFRDNDLEGTLADYTDESILITPDHVYKGMKEIRENFVSAFGVYPKNATTMQLNKSVVQRDVGYILWEATGPRIKLSFGTDTFVIKNGKIVSQTYAGVATPR